MATGVSELIVILLALGGFGVAPNPSAPGAAEVLKYAPAEAEVMVYADVQAVARPNWDALEKLPEAPSIKAAPAARSKVAGFVAEARRVRADVKAQAGFDPVTDVQTVAAFVDLRGAGDPSVLLVARGAFPAALVDQIAGRVGGTRSVIGGRTMVTSPDGKYAVALAADGALLGGTTRWVQERLGTFAPRRTPLGDVASAGLDGKPFLFAAMRLSPESLLRHAGATTNQLAIDLMTGLQDLELGVYANGIGLGFATRSASGYQRGLLAVDGTVELMRSGHHMVRGYARLAASAIDSFAQTDANVAAIAAHKADFLKLIDGATGDGSFQVAYDKKESERRLSVRATGRSLSEVLPLAGLMIPLGVYAAEMKR